MGELPPIAGQSLRGAFAHGAKLLRSAGADTPELDSRLLLMAAAGIAPEAYVREGEAPIPPTARSRYAAFIERRLAGEPVSRILGQREFYGRSFSLNAATLDPRPDTEVLVEAALSLAPREQALRILDLGTGSGCILITLLAELPLATGIGIDLNRDALAMAAKNAQAHGAGNRARFVCGDWLKPVSERFDVIVANPPYISGEEIAGLAREVKEHDPLLALDGGPDGLDAYRTIVDGLGAALKPGGTVLMEIGCSQADAVLGLLEAAGLAIPEMALRRDLAGLPRCVVAKAPAAAVRRS